MVRNCAKTKAENNFTGFLAVGAPCKTSFDLCCVCETELLCCSLTTNGKDLIKYLSRVDAVTRLCELVVHEHPHHSLECITEIVDF